MIEENKVEIIADQLRSRVKDGDFGKGERLPPVTQLAASYHASRQTMYEAIRILRAEGYLVMRGKSLYAQQIIEISGNYVPPFEQILASQSKEKPVVRNIVDPEVVVMPADIAKMFGQPLGIHMVYRWRVQGTENQAYRISEYWYPVPLVEKYIPQMKADPGFDVLEFVKADLGVTRQMVRDGVLTRYPTVEEAKLLAIPRISPVLEIRRTNRTMDGRVLMHHRILYISGLIHKTDYELPNRELTSA